MSFRLTEVSGMVSYTLFRVGDQLFAYRTEDIIETVRVERIFPVPKAPPYLRGVVNLRNRVVPVIDASLLLWNRSEDSDTAVIVEVSGEPVCLLVSKVVGITEVAEENVKPREEVELGDVREEFVEGVFEKNGDVVFLLSLTEVLKKRGKEGRERSSRIRKEDQREKSSESREGFVVFSLGNEWFALPVKEVREIVDFPERFSAVPQAPDYVEGIFLLRNEEVVLVSLRKLLSVPSDKQERRAIVTRVGRATVGMAVDEVKEIRWIDTGGVASLGEKNVLVLDGGNRLALILKLRDLFREEEIGDLVEESFEEEKEEDVNMKSFVSFRVGSVDMAVPIEKVREVIEIEEVTPLPGAPPYVKGMFNLRNSVIAVISLPERLGIERAEDSNRVVVLEGVPAGFTVSKLRGILRVKEENIQPVEEVTELEEKLLEGVIRTEEGNIVFVLDTDRVVREEDVKLLEERVGDGEG